MPMGPIGILLVDDEESDINAMRRALDTGRKFVVFPASNFDEALEAFHKYAPEIRLALLDVTLPGKNGVELAKTLLQIKPDLKVIFVSGHVGASVIRFYGINAGDEHFLQKPFDEPTLLRRVQRALESQQPLQRTLTAADSSIKDE